MKVLVIGNGGREHALSWKLAQSPLAEKVFIAPGNAGTAAEGENVDISPTDTARLIKFAQAEEIGLTVVGPEAPLAAGLVDEFHEAGLKVFGPSKAAAEIEASKAFCKKLLRHADVPTADYRAFRDAEAAERYLNDRDDMPHVVKADGLAAGKGVVVCKNRAAALAAVKRIGVEREFGAAGNQIVIEQLLEGQEASILAITDGQTILTLPAAQDHKPALDGDEGPNTGGMGAYCPTPLINDEMFHWIEENTIVPVVHALKRGRRPFVGVLYAGLMITNSGPKVLEFNARFGDPECQPLLMRMKSDLLPVLDAAANGRLGEIEQPEWDPRPAVCVVMASQGYPGSYETGKPIRGLDAAADLDNVKAFHAGTALADGKTVTSGGRVLGVTAVGDTISAAKLNAYTAVKAIRWDGAWCRKDISDKALSLQVND
ncbi:MAG: phosphoribosylamine--glycine ligase [Pirellulales bacterium]|nr:phosphoribosylamine--glycine ligase [Pirellulales bacterium]